MLSDNIIYLHMIVLFTEIMKGKMWEGRGKGNGGKEKKP